jgi:hypothetical protein
VTWTSGANQVAPGGGRRTYVKLPPAPTIMLFCVPLPHGQIDHNRNDSQINHGNLISTASGSPRALLTKATGASPEFSVLHC